MGHKAAPVTAAMVAAVSRASRWGELVISILSYFYIF